MAEKTYRRIDAVRKTCDILAVLADAKQPISGNEIAARVQESQGTVMCHLATLQDAGFVQEAGGGWRLGMKLALFWAKVKSGKESERRRIDMEITELGEG